MGRHHPVLDVATSNTNLHYGVATISRLLKIIGLFAKEPCERDDILTNRLMILWSLLIVAIPCPI